jgi:hypothetical protein
VLTACGHRFCRACALDYATTAGEGATCPECSKLLTIDFTTASADTSSPPAIREMAHGKFKKHSILSRIDTTSFQSSTKIEALREEIYRARQRNPSAKVSKTLNPRKGF